MQRNLWPVLNFLNGSNYLHPIDQLEEPHPNHVRSSAELKAMRKVLLSDITSRVLIYIRIAAMNYRDEETEA